jgi:hypothetical protein
LIHALHVLATDVEGKGFDQTIGEPFASKLLSTYRAARIPALENIDSQGSLGSQHGIHCATLLPFVYVNVDN